LCQTFRTTLMAAGWRPPLPLTGRSRGAPPPASRCDPAGAAAGAPGTPLHPAIF
jgi:hypothetical protein